MAFYLARCCALRGEFLHEGSVWGLVVAAMAHLFESRMGVSQENPYFNPASTNTNQNSIMTPVCT